VFGQRYISALLRLYWRSGSVAMAPHAALAEIGVSYELVLVERSADGSAGAEYLLLNPSGRVPTLEDGDLVITEAAAIILHLADRYPDSGLAPPLGSTERTEFYRWLVYLTSTVQPTLMRVIYPDRFGSGGVRSLACQEAHEQFEVVEGRLMDREWLTGDRRTGADLFLFAMVRFGRHLDPPAWDRPRLREHFQRTLALPGVAKMLAEQQLDPPIFTSAR
jgi:glutathione S-transferase